MAGIFHLAGEGNLTDHWNEIEKHMIVNEAPADFQSIFEAKVYGAWNLYRLIKDDPEKLLISFSSVSGTFGSASYSAYAAANSFLDSLTLHQRKFNPHAYCFSWSMWVEIGMSKGSLKFAGTAAERSGYLMITKEHGLSSMLAGISYNQPHLLIGINPTHPVIRAQTNMRPFAAQRLKGFFTLKADAAKEPDLCDITIHDCFNVKSACALTQLESFPLTENGGIDLEKLRSFDADQNRITGF